MAQQYQFFRVLTSNPELLELLGYEWELCYTYLHTEDEDIAAHMTPTGTLVRSPDKVDPPNSSKPSPPVN